MNKRDSILGGIPNGGLLLDKAPVREYELLTFDDDGDGAHIVYGARAWVDGRDGGLMCDNSGAPLQSASQALVRMFLAAQGWGERVPIASALLAVV